MGLRQSKRSVDISGSPKKEAPAPVVEKSPTDAPATVEKIDEEQKINTNGEVKATESPELVFVSLVVIQPVP